MTDDNIEATFFSDLSPALAEQALGVATQRSDDGELYFESTTTETLVWEDHRLHTNERTHIQGFGLRAVAGEAVGYSHASVIDARALSAAAAVVKTVNTASAGIFQQAVPRRQPNRDRYPALDPAEEIALQDKVEILSALDRALYQSEPLLKHLSVTITSQHRLVHLISRERERYSDSRPLVRVSVRVVLSNGQRSESGFSGVGGRGHAHEWINADTLRRLSDEAIRQAQVNLTSVPAPGGELTVVLGSGWAGILLHEAVGHGLEGDFNRKGSSLFAGKIGEKIAADCVTVIDDGTLAHRRGSLHIDDEGTPAAHNVLIEKGRLVGYMQDRHNARLMGMAPTGNARRESYFHPPMPRMTNTFMPAGEHPADEIIASVQEGMYAVSFGGGQVNITNGDFVFSCTEAYRIRNGKIAEALKGATLIGNGPQTMKKISMVGDNFALDPGIGICGKNGQNVPVGVGQPSVRIDGITVGGTGG